MDLRLEDCVNESCPWSGDPVNADSLTTWTTQAGETVVVGFCNTGCRDKFEAATKGFERAIASRA